jgi:YesN/AraC family two-component response regulator
MGYEPKEAANADAAMELMAEEPADIMLCDVVNW